MKTLTKVLCMLMVIVMCMSFFGAAAYAEGDPATEPEQTEEQTQEQAAPAEDAEEPEEKSEESEEEPEEPEQEPESAPEAPALAASLLTTETVTENEDALYGGSGITLYTMAGDSLKFKLSPDKYVIGSGDTINLWIWNNVGDVDPSTDKFYLDGPDFARIAYSVSSNECICFANSSLDKLSAGSYKLMYSIGGTEPKDSGETLEILESGSPASGSAGGLSVMTRYGDTWGSGDDVLWFHAEPSPYGCTVTVVSADGKVTKTLSNMDYNQTMGSGNFYLGISFLESLEPGWYSLWLTSNTDSTKAAYCQFRIEAGDVTLKPKNSSKHVTGSGLSLTFICSDPINTVFVGSKELANYDSYNYYYLSSDGKTITLTAQFMNNKLTAGSTYYLNVETDRGPATCAFQILTTAQATSSPQTGDSSNIALWTAMLIMTGVAAIVVIPSVSKRKVSE